MFEDAQLSRGLSVDGLSSREPHIVDEGSIVSAANQLGITKAASSKQLINLEAELNSIVAGNAAPQGLTPFGMFGAFGSQVLEDITIRDEN